MSLTSYKDLIVWQKSITLVKLIYQVTEHFPHSEQYGLSLQMRRCSVSIPSNIAEGYGRKSTKEYAQFFAISYGSSLELETQLIIAHELRFISQETFAKINELLEEILKMLNVMTRKIRDLNAIP